MARRHNENYATVGHMQTHVWVTWCTFNFFDPLHILGTAIKSNVCSVCGAIWCSLCQITLASCFIVLSTFVVNKCYIGIMPSWMGRMASTGTKKLRLISDNNNVYIQRTMQLITKCMYLPIFLSLISFLSILPMLIIDRWTPTILWTYCHQRPILFITILIIFDSATVLLLIYVNYVCLIQPQIPWPHCQAPITHFPLQIYHTNFNYQQKETIYYTIN